MECTAFTEKIISVKGERKGRRKLIRAPCMFGGKVKETRFPKDRKERNITTRVFFPAVLSKHEQRDAMIVHDRPFTSPDPVAGRSSHLVPRSSARLPCGSTRALPCQL